MVKVQTGRGGVVHSGTGERMGSYKPSCLTGSSNAGSANRSQYVRLADSVDVTCKKCLKMQTVETPAPVDEKAGVRAYVFNFKGRDGRHASVVFDRYGRGADQFNKYSRAQLTSNALGSVIQDPAYGPNWIDTYGCHVVPLTS